MTALRMCEKCAYLKECDGTIEWEVKQFEGFEKRIKAAPTEEAKLQAILDRTDWIRKLG